MVAHYCELIMFKQNNEVLTIHCAVHKRILVKGFCLK